MKTMNFRLLATIITLAAVITSQPSANAQRRSTGSSENKREAEVTSRERKENVQKKGTFQDEAIEKKAAIRKVSRTNVERNRNENNTTVKREVKTENRSDLRRGTSNLEKTKSTYDNYIRNAKRSANERQNTQNDFAINESRNDKDRRTTSYSGAGRGEGSGYKPAERERNNSAYNENARSTREKYNHNNSDSRYQPNNNYKGSKQYWSSEIRNNNNHINNRNIEVNIHNNYWDRNWENYRWNQNSWVNYYGYYNPFSYGNNKYYYHHRLYGHVIRRFTIQPQVYMHDNYAYYYFDGHFFRYHRGVGYILVDVPFGMTFEYIPDDYERVYINGFLYFRCGNLFFENSEFGFQLVHYPERYYAFDPDYSNQGFSF